MYPLAIDAGCCVYSNDTNVEVEPELLEMVCWCGFLELTVPLICPALNAA